MHVAGILDYCCTKRLHDYNGQVGSSVMYNRTLAPDNIIATFCLFDHLYFSLCKLLH